MRTIVTFLMVSLAILVVSGQAIGGTMLHSEFHQGCMAPLALLGTLGLARRARRMRRNQAI